MRPILRTALLASAAVSFSAPLALGIAPAAFAQAAKGASDGSASGAAPQDEQAPKQVQLSQQSIDNLIAAQKALQPIEAKMPQNGQGDDKPDAKVNAQIDAAIKKSGFADSQAYSNTSYSVGLVLAGLDPDSGDYVGPDAAIRKQMNDVEADKKMPAKEKKEAMEELKEAMKSAPTEKPLPGNADLVKKNLDRLSQGMQQAD